MHIDRDNDFALTPTLICYRLKGKKKGKNPNSKLASKLERTEISRMARLHHHESPSPLQLQLCTVPCGWALCYSGCLKFLVLALHPGIIVFLIS
jgi:hypothetical protein